MRARRHCLGNFVQMRLHRLGIAPRHHDRGTGAAGRADRAEEVGVLVAQIGGLTRAAALVCPLPDTAVFLPEPHFILKPDLDRRSGGDVFQRLLKRFSEVF